MTLMPKTKTNAKSESRVKVNAHWIVPDWPVPPGVHGLFTTRHGGVSEGVYASLNLGDHVGDAAQAVAENRARLSAVLPGKPIWLQQVHGVRVVDGAAVDGTSPPVADAAFTRQPGVVCVVMTADCLPVLFCDRAGTVVAAAHAGWRGLRAGILENTVAAMDCPGEQLLACLGPAIGPQAFEVGDEVRAAFVTESDAAAAAFRPVGAADDTVDQRKWLADLALLARQRLERLGVDAVFGGNRCTYSDAGRYFSYRRDGVTGRMAALIWLGW